MAGVRRLPEVLLSVLLLGCTGVALAQQSAHYSIPQLVENQGSGFRAGQTYQLSGDTISAQPVDLSTSASFSLLGHPLVTSDTLLPSCGLFINDDAERTSLTAVSLTLICSHATGCTQVELSNNGIGWSAPQPYSIRKPWTLAANDGNRKVFARFRNGLGNLSGVCFDSIVLDTTAPGLTISPVGGTFMTTPSITITASEPATIRYTTDGTDPKTSGTAQTYAGPFQLADDATVKAFAEDFVGNAGAVVSETYEVCNGNNLSISGLVMDATRNQPMPLVFVHLESGQSTNTTPAGAYAFNGLARGWYLIDNVTTPVPGYAYYQSLIKLCETSVAQNIVLTRDATVFGTDTSSGYSADGVNTSTGNFACKISDLALPGKGPSVVFERAYNSQDATTGPLGYGWTWNYNTSLSSGPEGELVVRWGDGKIEVWGPNGGGGYEPMYGVFSTLVQNPDTTFTLRRKDRVEFRFNAAGKLAKVVDEYGNQIVFSYTGARLTGITDTAGRQLALSYDASDRITNVLDPIGRSVSFSYDVNGDLVASTDMAGKITRYTYDANHQMKTLTDPMGNVVLTMVYDASRRVVTSQRDALGGETRYTYDVPSRTTTIFDALGDTSYHHFDELLRLVKEDDALGYSATYVFNAAGNMESVTDKRGNVTSYSYDAKGNVLTKTEPLGRVTTATYDAESNPLTKTDARGFSEVFAYDPVNGNLLTAYHCGAVPAATCKTDPSVTRTTYGYDPTTGQLLTVTEAAGHPTLERTTTYQYDVEGNRVAVIDDLGQTSTFTFDDVGRKLTENHPLGRGTAYEYDAMDRLLSVTDALGGQSQFTYDANGNKLEHLDARLHQTTFNYDAKDRLKTTIDALGQTETYHYDALDRRTGVTNPRGATATVVYDALGRVLQERDALGNVVSHEYDPNGNRTATIDAKGNRTTFAYDALNRLVSTTDPLGNTETYEYDLNGNRTKVTDPLGKSTVSTYDAFNRLVTVADPLGNSVTNSYDDLGRLIEVEDARGHATLFEYDQLDRLVEVTDAAGGIVTAAYDAIGNRTSVTDTRGKITTYEYDVLNRLVEETDPLGNSTLMTYDPVGNLQTLTNADGTTTYQYDDIYRVTELTYPDATTAAYEYDENGNRTSMQDQAGTTSFTYDVLDRLASVTDPFGLTVGYTYDPNGNRSSTRYPGNRSVFYYFDQVDRLIEVEDWGGVSTTYTYDDAGRLALEVMGNGATVAYTYDDAGRVLTKEDKAPGGALIASYTYTLDPNGNRVNAGVEQPAAPDVDLLADTFTHNDGNQLVASGGTTYLYDAKGNRVAKVDGAAVTQYTFNFRDHLIRIQSPTSDSSFGYNSDGQRLLSINNGTTSRYLLDLETPVESVLGVFDLTNVPQLLFVYGNGLLFQFDPEEGTRRFFHYDPVGNTVALTDESGAVVETHAYLPFGPATHEPASAITPFTFVGQLGVMREADGLFFMRARFYDPETARFLSVDPVPGALDAPQSLSPYTYAGNNPLLWTDPTGLVRWGQLTDSGLKIWGGAKLIGAGFGSLAAANPGGLAAVTVGGSQLFEGVFEGIDALRDRPQSIDSPVVELVATAVAFWTRDEDTVDRVREQTKLWETGVRVAFGVGRYVTNSGDGASAVGAFRSVGGPLISRTLKGLDSGPGQSRVGSSQATQVARQSMPLAAGRALTAVAGNLGPRTIPVSPELPAAGAIPSTKPRLPKKYLSVRGVASSYFHEEFKRILDPTFLDDGTRSLIEYAVEAEIAQLATKRYGYRTKKEKMRVVERRARDIAASAAGLYAQLTAALSKHEVVVRDMAELPRFSNGGVRRQGIYAGN